MTSFLNKTAGHVKENVLTQSISVVRTRGADKPSRGRNVVEKATALQTRLMLGAEDRIKKTAFTLAEVLVTLGIIGVVSAMTVPSLIQNYQRQSYVTQLHKVYNELSQALIQYQTDKNAVNLKEAGLNSQAGLDNFIKTYFKIMTDCGATSTPCFAPNTEYKKLTGVGAGTGQPAIVTLASGVSFAYGYKNEGDKLAIIDIDINGAKGPNIAGRDVFIIGIFNNGLIDDYGASTAPASKEVREDLFNNNCNSASGGWYGCFGKILNDNWQMTY